MILYCKSICYIKESELLRVFLLKAEIKKNGKDFCCMCCGGGFPLTMETEWN